MKVSSIRTITFVFLFLTSGLFWGGCAKYKEYESLDNRSVAESLLLKIQSGEYKQVEEYLEYLNEDRRLTNRGFRKLEVLYEILSERKDFSSFSIINTWCETTSHYSAYIVRGDFLLHDASRIRATGWASTVSDDQRNKMRETLYLAKKDLETSYGLNPQDPNSSALMIEVCMLLADDEQVMEKWFERAINADPIAFLSYSAKLAYLMPKWHGTYEKFTKFAVHCYDNSPEGSRVYSVMYDYLFELAERSGDFEKFYKNESVKQKFEEVINRLISDFPTSASPLIFKAEIHRKLGEYKESILLLDKALELNPNTLMILSKRGRSHFFSKQYVRAEKDYLKVVEIQPENHDALYMLGLVRTNYRSNYPKAIEYLDKAISLSDELSYRKARAYAAWRGKDFDKCIEDYSVVIEKTNANHQIYVNRGYCYKSKQDYVSALEDFDIALKMSPDDAFSLAMRAGILEKKGEIERAIIDIENALKVVPKNQSYLRMLQRFKEKLKIKL